VNATLSGGNITVPFDNTGGNITGIAIANTASNHAIDVTLIFQLEGSSQSTGITLQPREHLAFLLPVRYGGTANARGVVHFVSTPDMAILGLRFSNANSFTSLGNFQ
jgi:hypothetical protein